MGKPKSAGGLGLGAGPVALALAIVIFCLVAYLAITRRDVQSVGQASRLADGRRPGLVEPSSESVDSGNLSRTGLSCERSELGTRRWRRPLRRVQ
jgi:hypothetical protein